MKNQERLVGHAILDGYIEVYARAYSIPEALALESALRRVPVAEAYQPDDALIASDEMPEELPPEVEARAFADPEDSTDGLNVDTRATLP